MAMSETRRLKTPRGLLPAILALSAFLIISVHRSSVALVMTHEGCTWPVDWPKALDEVRNSCRTIEFATGIQENIYEIIFDDREQFEKLWPAMLTVKTPGAPLRLFTTGSPTISIFSNAKPTLRIFGSANGVSIALSEANNKPWDIDRLLEAGKALRSSPPWPAEIVSPNGELPEYVQATEEDGRMTWVAGDRNHLDRGFLYRARVDLELVVDGSVIDLNRIQLPSDGPIIHRRFDPNPCPTGQPCVMPPHDIR